MGRLDIRKSGAFDDAREFDKGRAEIFEFPEGVSAGRYTFEPGWRWSTHVAPRVGTRYCQSPHVGVCVSGRMMLQSVEGESAEIGPGDFLFIAPGHDAWVIGDAPCVILDFAEAGAYATRQVQPEKKADEPLVSLH